MSPRTNNQLWAIFNDYKIRIITKLYIIKLKFKYGSGSRTKLEP